MQKDFKKDIGLLKDFEKVKIDGEKFYSLLAGQYLKERTICYKMKTLSDY